MGDFRWHVVKSSRNIQAFRIRRLGKNHRGFRKVVRRRICLSSSHKPEWVPPLSTEKCIEWKGHLKFSETWSSDTMPPRQVTADLTSGVDSIGLRTRRNAYAYATELSSRHRGYGWVRLVPVNVVFKIMRSDNGDHTCPATCGMDVVGFRFCRNPFKTEAGEVA